jgi:O-antigen biosynthesis protein
MLRGLTTFLYLLQPFARLCGRVQHGLTPWRRHSPGSLATPLPRGASVWSEEWQAPDERIWRLEHALRRRGRGVTRGGQFDAWDLQLRGGGLGGVRIQTAVEDHGAGKQLMRLRCRPRLTRLALGLGGAFAALALVAALDDATTAFAVFLAAFLATLAAAALECARATGSFLCAVAEQERRELAKALREVTDEPSRNGRARVAPRSAPATLAAAPPHERARV